MRFQFDLENLILTKVYHFIIHLKKKLKMDDSYRLISATFSKIEKALREKCVSDLY